MFGAAEVESAELDPLCLWLKEAAGMKPKGWKTDEVKIFKQAILGLQNMKRNMVIRECYTHLQGQIVAWLKGIFNPALANGEERPMIGGLLIVTGTPGIGKSIFLAYMAVILIAEGYDIVIQRGNEWWSHIGGKARAHGEVKPGALLGQETTVLLFDPLAGGKVELDARPRGCSIVFTSPHGGSYKVAFKQETCRPTVLYMPTWSKPEVLQHKAALFQHVLDKEAEETAKIVEEAYDLLGGSVRWLMQVLKEGGTLSEAAHRLIAECLENCNYEDLLKAVLREPRNIQGEGKQSHLSLLLQITSAKPYHKAQVMLIESDVAHVAIRKALEKRGREGRQQFINVSLEYKELGSFVGNLFQDIVLEGLTAKTDPRTLQFRSVTSGGESGTVKVPPAKQIIERIERLSKGYKPKEFETNMLYVPESKSFPAADFFFVQKQDDGFVLWLLQTTKGKKHEFKLGSMHEKFKRYFAASDLKRVCAINWVIVAPNEAIAKEYGAEKKPDGQWKEEKVISPKQYVSWGNWSD